MRLENKVVVVTGAGRGIGKGIAVRLAEEGANIVVADVNLEIATSAVDEIKELGRKALPVKTDVSKWDDAQNLIASTVREFGRIDVLVNNAGINRDAMLHKMASEQWDQVIAVNLTGTFNCMKAAATVMREQEYGRIVNISSAGWLGNIGQANYSASKAGVIGLTKTAARELAKKNITVNAICPGFIDTEMTRGVPDKVWEIMVSKIPMGKVGTPRDIGNMVAFLASDDASYVTAEVINVGGGMIL
ncbi:MAG TPA: 3-oxoacyl-ACP reductase [Firmicutes bacterium]|jgi:3-oxoacyl-(acyl-carrier-protein) reductase|nr:3-oxoacyl-ACP reductase [Bacillota bacterium]